MPDSMARLTQSLSSQLKIAFNIGVSGWCWPGVVSHHCHPFSYDTPPILKPFLWSYICQVIQSTRTFSAKNPS